MTDIKKQYVSESLEEIQDAVSKALEIAKENRKHSLIVPVEKISPAVLVELTNHLRKSGYRVYSFYGMTMMEIVW